MFYPEFLSKLLVTPRDLPQMLLLFELHCHLETQWLIDLIDWLMQVIMPFLFTFLCVRMFLPLQKTIMEVLKHYFRGLLSQLYTRIILCATLIGKKFVARCINDVYTKKLCTHHFHTQTDFYQNSNCDEKAYNSYIFETSIHIVF